MLDVSEMRIPVAQTTRKNAHPNPTSQAEMILSGTILVDLRDFEEMIGKQLDKLVFSGSDASEEPIGT